MKKLTTKEFIDKSIQVHSDKYNSKVDYKRTHEKICIICKKHGEFWQMPSSHLSDYGCPICKESRLEREISKLLDKHNITYSRQMSFNWLCRQSLDFYLPLYQIGAECQGEQHFKPVKHFGGSNKFKKMRILDSKKHDLCEINNVSLLYYTNVENVELDSYIIYNKDNFFTEEEKLIEKIKNVKIH